LVADIAEIRAVAQHVAHGVFGEAPPGFAAVALLVE
jgi:hypothetical protein